MWLWEIHDTSLNLIFLICKVKIESMLPSEGLLPAWRSDDIGFWEKKKLSCEIGRQGSTPSPRFRIRASFKGRGEQVGMQKCWQHGFWLESFGAWSFIVRYGKGLLYQIVPDNGPFTSERFWCSCSDHLPVLWFHRGGVRWREKRGKALVLGTTGGQNCLLCTFFD